MFVTSLKMNHQHNLPLALCLLLILFTTLCYTCSSPQELNDPNKEEWIAIFNGANFQDWTPKFAGYESGLNYKDRFLLKDSLLSVRYAAKDTFKANFGHLFYKEKFSYYRLKATYRFVGAQMPEGPGWAFRNNGLMLHCQSPQSMALTQDFPVSLEMQLLGGNGIDERPTGNLCTPGSNVMMADTLFTTHCINSSSPTFHGDQWVHVEALVLGDSIIQHIVEGTLVLEYSKPTAGGGAVSDESYLAAGTPIKEGFISIQSETHPIDFQSMTLLNLCGCMDQKAKNYKSYFVKADNSTCVY